MTTSAKPINVVRTVPAMNAPSGPGVSPFIKWAGGKRHLADELEEYLRWLEPHNTYFEPFLGGGALFFRARPSVAVLGDTLHELIHAFTCVRDEVEHVIRHVRAMRHEADTYYRIRNAKLRCPAAHAARFIYLNKKCFTGLYRVKL